MVDLFTQDELSALTGQTYTDAQFSVIMSITTDILTGEVGDRITDPPQPGVKGVALAVAARVMVNPGGISSEQAGGMLISYFNSQTGLGLTADETRRLRRAVGLASGASSVCIAPPERYQPFRNIWGPT